VALLKRKNQKVLTKNFGLIGYPLSHSFSESYFREKFLREGITDCIFKNIEVIDLDYFISNLSRELTGFCITMPYKEKIIPYCDELDTNAKEIGAINVVKVITDKNKTVLKGYNSDIVGFDRSLFDNISNMKVKALILGTGGASKAVSYVLKKNGIDFKFVSRHPKNNNILSYNQIDKSILESYKLIINTTPLGMHPFLEEVPNINIDYITPSHIIFDLIYNPSQTIFMKLAKAKGAKTINGFDMLCYQAEEAWRIWNAK